jgi:hypothetical protein
MITIVILVIFGLAFFLALFVLVSSGSKKFSEKDQKFVLSHWNKIVEQSKVDAKGAIMDADKLLDHVLKKKGYSGSLGEMLKKSGPLFSDLNSVWHAHKIRNRLAHEIAFTISPQEGKNVLAKFKRAFRDLGVKI